MPVDPATWAVTILKLEAIGDHHRAMAIATRRRPDLHWTPPRRMAPGVLRGPWVAEITGVDQRGRIARDFLPAFKDFTHANSQGSRGIWHHWALVPGRYYEVHEIVSFARTERWFAKVVAGAIVRVPFEEVVAWWTRP